MVIFNKKKGEDSSRESSPIFDRRCSGTSAAQSWQAGRVVREQAGLEEAQTWDQPVAGIFSPSLPMQRDWGMHSPSSTACFCLGWAEGGSRQLAPCPGIVLGLNGRQLGFSGDLKSFLGTRNPSCLPYSPGADRKGLLMLSWVGAASAGGAGSPSGLCGMLGWQGRRVKCAVSAAVTWSLCQAQALVWEGSCECYGQLQKKSQELQGESASCMAGRSGSW